MAEYSPLHYFKGLVLWNLATDKNPYVDCIINSSLFPNGLSDKIAGMRDLIDDNILGYRLYRKPGAYVDDFTLEKGCWSKEDYFHDWTYFAIFNELNTRKNADRLIRGIHYYVQENGVNVDELLDELWSEYWIIDVEVYSYIRQSIKYGDFTPPIEDIEDLYIVVTDKITSAKRDSQNLDEWLDRLHSIIPLVVYGVYLSNFDDEEAKRYNRFFEEAKADIIAVFGVCFHGAIINDKSFFFMDYFPKEEDEIAFQKKLKYDYNSRVSIPKYWYELAKECYNNIAAMMLLSEPLGKYDYFNLVGCFCHLSLFHLKNSLQFISTGVPPNQGEGKIYMGE